jgi:hypothetical protein
MKRIVWASALMGLAACSATDATGTTDGFTQGQAEAFAKQIGAAFGNGMGSASTVEAPESAPPPGGGVDPARVLVNVQVNHRTNCTAGGRMEVSGSITGVIDDQTGSGTLFSQTLETITDWRCITGFVVNGDPYISGSGNMSFAGGQLASTASFNFGGGFRWGTAAKDGCSLILTILINPDYSGRVSGVVCGYSVDVTF